MGTLAGSGCPGFCRSLEVGAGCGWAAGWSGQGVQLGFSWGLRKAQAEGRSCRGQACQSSQVFRDAFFCMVSGGGGWRMGGSREKGFCPHAVQSHSLSL